MDRRSIILVGSCFSRQDAANGTHDDLNEPALQSDPGHSQGHYIIVYFTVRGITPPRWVVLPECYHFSENLLSNVVW